MENHSQKFELPVRDLDTALTHVDETGAARMVDVGGKSASRRTAIAQAVIVMSSEAAEAIRNNLTQKGDCIQVSRIAAIQASKWTHHMIPLCHTIPLDSVEITAQWEDVSRLKWIASVKTTGGTGAEMEALHAASIAALTTYDMCKGMDPSMSIENVWLVSKTGGVRGDYDRSSNEKCAKGNDKVTK